MKSNKGITLGEYLGKETCLSHKQRGHDSRGKLSTIIRAMHIFLKILAKLYLENSQAIHNPTCLKSQKTGKVVIDVGEDIWLTKKNSTTETMPEVGSKPNKPLDPISKKATV